MKIFNRLFILLLIQINLFASSLLTEYRNNGLDALEKELDAKLTQEKYWNNVLESTDTRFGYLESYKSILVCNKEQASLSFYKYNQNMKFIPMQQYNAFTGKVQGDKIKEGDLKTPIGIYDLEKRISKLDSFYGPLAFVTTYPNIYDKYLGKNGSGIWIHGLPIEQERDDFTRGCIAINNDNILCLDKEIKINSTVLIINPVKLEEEVSQKIYSNILANLYSWRYSWLYNDTKKYLSFYAKEFVRHDGMKYEKFVKYKTRIFNKKEKKKIIFNGINIIPYPSGKNIFLITFKESYTSESFSFKGDKTLIVQLDAEKNFKILTEK